MESINTIEANVTNLENGPKKRTFKSPLEGEPMIEHSILLASLLNGLAVMTEKFKLKWQECVETICLLSLAQEILNHPGIVSTVYIPNELYNFLIVCYKYLFLGLNKRYKSM